MVQTKEQLEKLYTSSDKIEEQICAQIPSYDKTGLGFFLGQSSKNPVETKEPITPKVNKDLRKIDDTSKDKVNFSHSEKVKESNQDMNNKRKQSFSWCDEPEDTEVNCKGKSFKPIQKFIVIIVMDMVIMQQIVRNLNLIMIMQIVGCIGILTM